MKELSNLNRAYQMISSRVNVQNTCLHIEKHCVAAQFIQSLYKVAQFFAFVIRISGSMLALAKLFKHTSRYEFNATTKICSAIGHTVAIV